MKIVSWNIRVLGRIEKRMRIKEFIRQRNIDMVLFQETKRSEMSELFVKSLWLEDLVDFMAVNADGITGGLLCVWRPEVFDLIDCCSNRNCIILSGKIHQLIECVVVNVNAPNDRSMRRNLWKILGNLKPKFSKLWCIGGDFNEIRIVAEREGCIRRDGEMNEFNDFINTLELVDVPMIMRRYTWCNSQEGEMWSRLDRFLVSPEWLEWFSFKLWGLSRSLSDHCPILLMEDERD
ncbi:uncharacterized protein LOC114306563 [Camellia sinensis]|uniref:uncharacterized protein LOC114306563 n=1 Tax=Camellia sinensis TaxID=4442 RepID=UPI0010361327|nr:uncharacterized protein LOC114306563 [Camellia sinensis]